MRILLVFLFIFNLSFATNIDRIKNAIDSVDFNDVLIRLIIQSPDKAKIIASNYNYFKRNYKVALLALANIESKFRYKQGIYDKHDLGYFQINTKIWSVRDIRNKLGIITTKYQIKHNPRISANVALAIWLYNVGSYIQIYRKHPVSLAHYTALYHKVSYIDKKYYRKVNRVIWRYYYKYKNQ